MPRARTTTLFALLALAFGCHHTMFGPEPAPETQGARRAGLAADVALALRDGGLDRPERIEVRNDDGVIQLSGHVASARQAVRAEELAAQVEGVVDVVNTMTIDAP